MRRPVFFLYLKTIYSRTRTYTLSEVLFRESEYDEKLLSGQGWALHQPRLLSAAISQVFKSVKMGRASSTACEYFYPHSSHS